VPLRRPKLTFILAGIVGLVSFVIWRAPVIREIWREREHHRCLKQLSADSELHKAARVALGEGRITRGRVREFLNANYPDLPVHDDEAGIRAGTLVFASGGESNTVSYVPKGPCVVF
jgi:hypothetical protein